MAGTAIPASRTAPVTIIRPRHGWQLIDWRELYDHRELFWQLAWRDIRVLYAQTILGFSWALLQPLVQIVLFTFVFGKVAQIGTDGIPYVLFSTVAIVPWTYMSQAMTQSSESLVQGQNMLGKIYFPRLIFPMTPVLARLVDFCIAMTIVAAVAVWYRVMPTWNLLLLPLFMMLMVATTAGIGLWLSAMAIRFRDVKHAMAFVVRLLIYTAPIVYSASTIPDSYRFIYSLNPIVGVVEGFRAAILGGPVPWTFILPGMVTGVLLLVSGALYFRRMERVFVDVI